MQVRTATARTAAQDPDGIRLVGDAVQHPLELLEESGHQVVIFLHLW